MRITCQWILFAAFALVNAIQAEAPEYPQKTEGERPPLIERLRKEVAPLKNSRGKRWPMILWECVSFELQEPQVYETLLARGLTQHIHLDEKMIPAAKAIQEAGSPVIMMQGAGGPWPYNLGKSWEHQFDEGYEPKKPDSWWPSWKACPAIFDGWRVNAERIREIMRQYRAAGVTVDAVWMDWEGEPSSSVGEGGWENARHCKRCRETVPGAALRSHEIWRGYCYRLHKDLIGTYLAAPVREVFPRASLTNWMVVCSTPERPAPGWWNRNTPPAIPSLLTATNPIAYGNDTFWDFWNKEWPVNRKSVDRFYTHLLLRQVSDDSANKQIYAPDKDCFPWVARWCPDSGDPKIPMISREAYRESLRHIWLRGADSLQIFNASRKGYEDIVFAEVADAVAVYDEMLPFSRLIDEGEILCLDVPGVQSQGILWSGLRLEQEAVVRVINQGEGKKALQIEPWGGLKVELEAAPDGATYHLTRKGDEIRIDRKK